MSNIAKQRLLTVGARFSSYEHENAIKDESRSHGKANIRSQHAGSSNKMSFWKKTSGKVPGRPVYGAQHPPLQATDAHLSTYIRSGKANRTNSDNSFQEFEGSTMDAWDEKEDDSVRGVNPEGSISPVEYSLSDLAVESADSSVEDESLTRPPLQNVSSDNLARHPAPAGREIEFGRSLSNTKQNFVSKLSEKLGKSNKARESGATSERSDFIQPPEPPSPIRQMKLELDDQESSRMERFGKLIAGPVTDLDQLRKLSWNGIPRSLRPMVWRLLSGYLPPSIDRRQATHERKQREYHGFVEKYYHTRHDDEHHETYRQIHIDIPRTNPLIPIFQQRVVQELFERILFIWAIRHPASGYVQGINDLVVPFFIVFLSEFTDKEIETCNIEKISKEALDSVEADSFWCLSKLLDGIQDNYTFAQPGIQMKINALKELVSRINDRLHQHIVKEHIDYLQFTFRWMNNLLMRELPLRCSIRLWDTYWSEPDGFAAFHLYVCAALLTLLSKEILEKNDFQSLMTFLQNIPSRDWNDDDVSCLVAEAYRLMYVFAGAPKHLR